jgi:hypothetical protein
MSFAIVQKFLGVNYQKYVQKSMEMNLVLMTWVWQLSSRAEQSIPYPYSILHPHLSLSFRQAIGMCIAHRWLLWPRGMGNFMHTCMEADEYGRLSYSCILYLHTIGVAEAIGSWTFACYRCRDFLLGNHETRKKITQNLTHRFLLPKAHAGNLCAPIVCLCQQKPRKLFNLLVKSNGFVGHI